MENIGTTHEKRPILVLNICANRRCGSRPIIWIDSGIHGREWIGPAVVSYLAMVRPGARELESYRKFELLQELVENNDEHRRVTSLFDWYILTVANPDGYEETFTSNRYR